MNTPVTSRDEILQAARAFVIADGERVLSMRALARQCGIAVGSLYNYFPAKTDLMIAVVSEIWGDILRPALCAAPNDSFLALVKGISKDIRAGAAAYPSFLGTHTLVIDDKDQGRGAMEAYFHRVEQILCQVLVNDPAVRPGIWTEDFTPEQLAAFVFKRLRTDFLRGEAHSDFLFELLRRVLY